MQYDAPLCSYPHFPLCIIIWLVAKEFYWKSFIFYFSLFQAIINWITRVCKKKKKEWKMKVMSHEHCSWTIEEVKDKKKKISSGWRKRKTRIAHTIDHKFSSEAIKSCRQKINKFSFSDFLSLYFYFFKLTLKHFLCLFFFLFPFPTVKHFQEE